jgi:branched-chain amino acid transport system permease protein
MMGLRRGNHQKAVGIIVLLAGVLSLPLIANPYYITVGVTIGLFAILTMGLTMLMGYTGQVSMGQSAFYGLGAYLSALLVVKYGLNPWIALIIAALLTGGFSALISIPLLKLTGHVLAVVTLGLAIIFYNIIGSIRQTRGFTGMGGIPHLSVGSFVLSTDTHYYYLVWIAVFVLLALSLNIINSRVGRAFRAIHPYAGGSEIAASSLGVSLVKYKAQAFALCSIYASIAGSIYAHWITYIEPDAFAVLISIEVLVMMNIGGAGSVWGSICGAAIVLIAREVFRAIMPLLVPGTWGEYEIIGYGLVLIFVLMFLPHGLVSTPNVIRAWIGRTRSSARDSQTHM